jgi:hypothetical protein
MTTFTPLFVNEFRLMTLQSFNKKNGIWHPQEYSKTYSIGLKDYSNGHVSRAFFSRCLTPSKREAPFTFILNKGLRASEAIYAIGNKKPAILDSGCAYMLVFYRALCSYLGEEKFNVLYDRFILRANPFDTLTKFFFEKVSIQSSAEIQPGDQCCFKNLLAYTIKHGLHENTYVVCNSDNNFMGLGFQGSTKSEVEESLFRQYNESPHANIKGPLRHHTVTKEEFIDKQTKPPFPHEGRLVLEVLRLQIARIEQMANTPIEEIAELLESWSNLSKRHCPEPSSISSE